MSPAPQSKSVRQRCAWCLLDPLYIRYHDQEWGRPQHNDRMLFELLILEGAQAGLSWITILKKRNNYRKAFDNFDARRISRYSRKKFQSLMKDAGIVRNRLKIRATIDNAKAFLQIQNEFGSFNRYIWEFAGGKPKVNRWKSLKQIPPRTAESDAMCKDLKKRGFRFVGSTICYSFMQATGMVNDHVVGCWRRRIEEKTVSSMEKAVSRNGGGKDVPLGPLRGNDGIMDDERRSHKSMA